MDLITRTIDERVCGVGTIVILSNGYPQIKETHTSFIPEEVNLYYGIEIPEDVKNNHWDYKYDGEEFIYEPIEE